MLYDEDGILFASDGFIECIFGLCTGWIVTFFVRILVSILFIGHGFALFVSVQSNGCLCLPKCSCSEEASDNIFVAPLTRP